MCKRFPVCNKFLKKFWNFPPKSVMTFFSHRPFLRHLAYQNSHLSTQLSSKIPIFFFLKFLKNHFWRKIFLHSNFYCVFSSPAFPYPLCLERSHDLCAHAHAHSLEGTLVTTVFEQTCVQHISTFTTCISFNKESLQTELYFTGTTYTHT